MKRLILLRHAKAVPAGTGPDHARDLAPRGLTDAAWAGDAIAAAGWVPDAALVSDARRTQRTFAEAAARLPAGPALTIEPFLYNATPDHILDRIAAIPDSVGCLLVIGHNPGIAETALHLASRGAEAHARLAGGFPTAALAVFAVPGPNWRDLAAEGATLEAFLTPPR